MATSTRGRRAVLAVALVALCTSTSCASAGAQSSSQGLALLAQQGARQGSDLMAAGRVTASAKLIQQMRSTARQARSVDELPLLTRRQYGVSRTTGKIERQLGQVPEDPATEMARVARQLRQLQRRLDEIKNIQQAADRAESSLRADAGQISRDTTVIADGYLPPREVARLRRELADKAYNQALAMGCDTVWDALAKAERDDVWDAYNEGLVETTFSGRLAAATSEAVVDDAYQQVVATMGERAAAVVGWGDYGLDVLDKVADLQENDWQALREITASGHTTALIHYARVCLRKTG